MTDHFPSGRLSPSFAQSTAEFTLSDSDDDDDVDDVGRRLREAEVGGEEVYELKESAPDRAVEEAIVEEGPPPAHGDEDEWTGDGRPSSSRRRASPSAVASFQLYTPDEEKAVVKKLDRRLVLFVAFLYMLSFVDRSNIGNARIAGMEEDLQTSPPWDGWYEWSLTAFYISYISFEWMSLLWKLVPAHMLVSVIVLFWGLAASLQSVAVSYPMLVFMRLVLGIGEAGFTGIPFYLSFFFKRDELAFRTAIFLSAAPLATTFASSLAWLIIKLGQSGPVAPWRILFLVEGFPSIIAGALAWKIIPDSPQTTSYLTSREKKVARLRLRDEKSDKGIVKPSSGLKARELLAVLRDPIAWITAAMFFLTNMAYSSLPVFLPKILTEMGHDAVESQALSAPPYFLAFLIVLITAHLSDKSRSRAIPIVFHSISSAVGYAVLALAETLNLAPMVRYVAVYPAAIGFFNVVVLIIAWTINNQKSESRQGGGFAMLQTIGQCGPLVGTRLYPDRDAPFYTRGMGACAGAMLTVTILTIILRLYLGHLNRRMDRNETLRTEDVIAEEEEGLVGGSVGKKTPVQVFRYIL